MKKNKPKLDDAFFESIKGLIPLGSGREIIDKWVRNKKEKKK